MSILNSTRINFYGGYSTNVCTVNNNDILDYIDPVNCTLQPAYASMTDEQVEGILIAPVVRTGGGQLNGKNGATSGASWNYYGDMTQAFEGVKISSAGAPGEVTEDTALTGLPVYLLGSSRYASPMMIDTDPTGTSGTQVFLGGIQIGDGKDALIIRSNQRCFSYFIGARFIGKEAPSGFTGAGAIWQCSFPVKDLPKGTTGKPELDAFLTEAGKEQGIVLRFSMFEIAPTISNTDLLKDFQAGQRPINPAKGYTVGTLGIWKKGELETSPAGRLLNSTKSLPGMSSGTFEVFHGEGQNETAIVSLDLVNSLPKAKERSNLNDLSDLGPNLDLGSFHLEAGGENLGEVPYDPADYFKFGGICDVPISSTGLQAVTSTPLKVVSDDVGSFPDVNLFEEAAYRIQTDERANYLEGESSLTPQLRVTYLGGPMPHDTTLNVSSSTSGKLLDPLNLMVNGDSSDSSGAYSTAFTVPKDETDLTVTIKATKTGGLSLLNFRVGDLDDSKAFLNFRVYPEDDYSKEISAGNISWNFVYDEVLRYYYLTYPAMSLRIPLNDPESIQTSAAGFIQRLTEPDFLSGLMMPPTREMSPGKKALLLAYLQQISETPQLS